MPSQTGFSLPLQLTFRFVLTIGMMWGLSLFFDQYFSLHGGIPAIIILGALLTFLNVIARPILHALTAPLAFVAGLLAFIISNALFLWLMLHFVSELDPKIITLTIHGWTGYIVTPIVFGIGNWVMKEVVRV